MNIQQLTDKLPQERLEQFMLAPIWKSALLRGMSWPTAICNKQAVQEAVQLLTPYASDVLKAMLREFAAVPIEEDRLLKEARMRTALSGAECQLGIDELLEAGVLFAVRKVWGEQLLFIPIDCFLVWQQTLFPCAVRPLSSSGKERLMSGTIRPFCRPLGRQLLSAFSVLAQSGLELTAKGVLAKKTITKLVQAVDWDELPLSSFRLKWSSRDHYPLTVAFILEAATAFGLLHQAEGKLNWDEDKLNNWLKLDDGNREQQLRGWCLELLLPAGKSSSHIAAVLCSLQPGLWYSEREFIEQLNEANLNGVNPHSPVSSEESSAPDWCGLFHSLGWLELVDSKDSLGVEQLIRWKGISPLHEQNHNIVLSNQGEGYIFVQPNGEIIVQSDCPFSIRWELELIAKRISDEQAAVYQLEAASISRALEHGRTRASIQSFLQKSAGDSAIPAAVQALLELWSSRSCRTTFAEVMLLRCDNEQMAVYIENDLSIAPLLVQKLGSLDFIVEKSHVQLVRSLLQQAGYPPRKAVQAGLDKEQNSYPLIVEDVLEQHLVPHTPKLRYNMSSKPTYIYEEHPLHHFELIALPDRNNGIPLSRLESVPAMWTKQLRAYHHSTRKELMEHALEWQTPVQLCIEQKLQSFVPDLIEQQGSGWAVVGLLRDEHCPNRIRLTPDMWDEMRLIIPGHTEPI